MSNTAPVCYNHPTDDGVVNYYGVTSESAELDRAKLTCDHCNIPITKQRSHVNDENYCSDICRAVSYGKARMCPKCNFKSNLVGRLMSHYKGEHGDDWWQTVAVCEVHYDTCNQFNYGVGWNESKKKEVRERDGYVCQSCGVSQERHKTKTGKSLHVHHIQPAKSFESDMKRNAVENLVSLCASCHVDWEGVPIRPTIKKYRVGDDYE